MADIPLSATGYSCVFNALVPVVKNNPTVFPDVDKFKMISVYSTERKKNISTVVEISAFCYNHIPHICAYYPEYYEKYKKRYDDEIYQELSCIQDHCTGHRAYYSIESFNTIKSINTSEIILAEQFNRIKQIITDELIKRQNSEKYHIPKAPDVMPGEQTTAIQISKVLPDDVSITDNVIKEQLANLLKYINSSELLSDQYKAEDDDTITNKLDGDIITEDNKNYIMNTIKSVVNDCICYSDCNGYSVCWCYGNCNHY